jgi:hypothetical protein
MQCGYSRTVGSAARSPSRCDRRPWNPASHPTPHAPLSAGDMAMALIPLRVALSSAASANRLMAAIVQHQVLGRLRLRSTATTAVGARGRRQPDPGPTAGTALRTSSPCSPPTPSTAPSTPPTKACSRTPVRQRSRSARSPRSSTRCGPAVRRSARHPVTSAGEDGGRHGHAEGSAIGAAPLPSSRLFDRGEGPGSPRRWTHLGTTPRHHGARYVQGALDDPHRTVRRPPRPPG